MTISFSRYVRITSGVGASVGVRTRDLIGRLFSTSSLISPNAVLEFTDAAAVGEYFGTSSDEYARAAFYFAYISPNGTQPKRLSFARYAPGGTGARIYGGTHASLTSLQQATAGAFDLVFYGGLTAAVSGINLSGAASFADVAALVQTAVRAVVGDNTSNALVTYDAVGQRFVFDATFIAEVTIGIEASASGVNDLATALGWLSADAILTDGALAQEPVDAFTRAENLTNNFGSFSFIPALTLTQHVAVAQLNAGRNVAYQYHLPALSSIGSWSAALIGFAGTGITWSPKAGEFPELLPVAVQAATDYSRRDAVVNYQFKQAGGLTPSVTSDTDADLFDSLRVNYYGQTQTAGQKLSFYQRGVLCGGAGAALDMNVYSNEQWLKDHAGAGIMSLLLSTGRVPANATGRGQILAVLQDTIDLALFNGTISIGKTLDAAQQAFVTSQTGDPLAWRQLQALGYWVDARIVSEVVGGVTTYKAQYTLLYAKDDAIRAVEGAHLLV